MFLSEKSSGDRVVAERLRGKACNGWIWVSTKATFHCSPLPPPALPDLHRTRHVITSCVKLHPCSLVVFESQLSDLEPA
jgi:hypothetical protein